MKEFKVDKLSSLSGLTSYQDLLFAISDEFYSVAITNLENQLIYEFDVKKNETLNNLSFLERKKIKPDFESLSILKIKDKTCLHIMPSLSKANRTEGYLLEFNYDKSKKSLDIISNVQAISYSSLQKILVHEGIELNIEGHLFYNENLLLLNRGNLQAPNKLILLNYDFSKFDAKFIQCIDVDLGLYENFPIQWTDAIWKNQKEIYFSATVEQTKNAIDDGEVLASFIGEYHLLDKKVTKLEKILDNEKIEGLSYIKGDLVVCIDPDKQGSHGKIFYGIKL